MSRSSSIVRLLTSCLLLAVAIPLGAATFTSSQNGNWSASSTWGGAGVPGAGDTANVGHTVTLDVPDDPIPNERVPAVARIPSVLLAALVPLVAAVAVVITLSVTSEPGSGVGAPTRPNAITIKNFAFLPARVEVKAGAAITVTNADGVVHTVTADRGGFDTGRIDASGRATITVDAPGKYAYHCEVHNYMTGVIEAT